MKEFFCLMFLCSGLFTSAQGVFSNEMNTSLEKVLQDYPNRLVNVKGDLVAKRGQVSEYSSLLQVPGTISTTITESRNQLTWKVIVDKESDFVKASEKFEALYSQINKAIIRSGREKPFILTGNYAQPSATRNTQIKFDLLPATGDLKNVVVQLNMHRVGKDYVIDVSVNNR